MLNLVHTDVKGPVEVAPIGGAQYFIMFIGDHSSWATTYRMSHKPDVMACYLDFEMDAERQTEPIIQATCDGIEEVSISVPI